eukprot:122504-Alexandrium_andersonii.AAC.1
MPGWHANHQLERSSRRFARPDGMVTAQRRGHDIRGIARVPPSMGAVNDSVNPLERPRHHVAPSAI